MANDTQLKEAAQYLEGIFGDRYAWCGGWALRLRGSTRTTEDLDLVVQAPSTASIWDDLLPYEKIRMYYHRHILAEGGDQFKIFVDVANGGLVCVDVILAGRLETPLLESQSGVDKIVAPARLQLQGEKRVMSLRWQVHQKLHAIGTRRKETDYLDLQFLVAIYEAQIQPWITEEDEALRRKYFSWVYDNTFDDDELEKIKRLLGLL